MAYVLSAKKASRKLRNHISLGSPYQLGNLKAIICWIKGHVWDKEHIEYYQDSSEFTFYTCKRCHRTEGK